MLAKTYGINLCARDIHDHVTFAFCVWLCVRQKIVENDLFLHRSSAAHPLEKRARPFYGIECARVTKRYGWLTVVECRKVIATTSQQHVPLYIPPPELMTVFYFGPESDTRGRICNSPLIGESLNGDSRI